MKILKSERGQSLVEMAISLVVLLWLLSGAVEFGLGFFQFIQLRDAAQEGALYGSIHPPASSSSSDANRLAIIARVRSQSNSPVDLSDTSAVTVTVTTTGSGCITDAVVVTVAYTHDLFMPFAELFTGGAGTIPISASTTDTILVEDNC